MTLLERAFLMASALHSKQTRKASIVPGAPYISHLMEVAGMVLANGGNEQVAAAALLHDALEDVGAEVAERIREECGPEVLSLVLECTEAGTGTGEKAPWRERKAAYIAHIAQVSADALLISVSDKLQSIREVKRQYRLYDDDVYEAFAKKANASVEERKDAFLWFQTALVSAFAERWYELARSEPVQMLDGIQALIIDFREIVEELSS